MLFNPSPLQDDPIQLSNSPLFASPSCSSQCVVAKLIDMNIMDTANMARKAANNERAFITTGSAVDIAIMMFLSIPLRLCSEKKNTKIEIGLDWIEYSFKSGKVKLEQTKSAIGLFTLVANHFRSCEIHLGGYYSIKKHTHEM